MQDKPEIAYVLKGFPRLSETFIAGEIRRLEEMGLKLRLFSVKAPGEALIHPVVKEIESPLFRLPQASPLSDRRLLPWLVENLPRFASAHIGLLLRRPAAYLKTLAQAVAMTLRYSDGGISRPKKVFIKEFLQAGSIAREILKAGNVGHVHGHFCHGATTITWFVSQITGLPFSFTAHAKDIYKKSLNPGDLLTRKIRAARFVATCTGSNKDHLQALAPESASIHRIYHGLDTRYFAPQAGMRENAVPTILSIGRFVEKKGFHFLVEACRMLKEQNISFHLAIVGEKDDQYDFIQDLIERHGLTGDITLRHPVAQDGLLAIYREATLFALPCQTLANGDRDGIPNVLVEAMAMGLPVVSTRISGIPELIEDGVNGLLVPEKDPRALHAALARLLTDRALRERLGQGGRDTVCRDYDSTRTTRALYDLFLGNPTPALAAPEAVDMRPLLKQPYDSYSPDERLRHFRQRTSVNFFAVPDAEETRRDKIDALLENRFEFNGEAHTLGEPLAWLENPSRDIEWHIMLHKFYYAVGLGMAFNDTEDHRYLDKWMSLTQSWIEETPPGFIASDVTGRRIQSWIYAYYHFVAVAGGEDIPAGFHDRFLASLEQQTEYLVNNLAPARNHRTLELYAIFLAAVVFPEFEQSAAWREFSLGEIVNNMREDLLADGVQCELSTDYHHIVLKNYLSVRRLAKINGIAVPEEMDAMLMKALEFSLHVHRPDGQIPSFSDGDTGSFLDLLEYGGELFDRQDMIYVATKGQSGAPPKRRSRGFEASGYYTLRSGWGKGGKRFEDERHLVFDCGPLGAGNHGHLDLLSFELFGHGRPLIVDPGRYTYHEGGEVNWRVLFRGTGYHNTVQVDGKNQTLYAPGKRKYKIQGPPPEFTLKAFLTAPEFDFLDGEARSHEYDAVHERKIVFAAGEYFLLFDRLTAEETHDYDQLFHLSPAAEGALETTTAEGTRRLISPGLVIACPEGERCHIDAGFVSSRYGVKEKAPIVRTSKRGQNAAFTTVLFPYAREAPDVVLETLAVTRADGSPGGGEALVVHVNGKGGGFLDLCFLAPPGERETFRIGAWQYDGRVLLIRQPLSGESRVLYSDPDARLEHATVSMEGYR